MEPLQILIVEDDENDVILLQKELRAGGLVFESRVVDTHSDFMKTLDESIPDLIIADFQLPRFDALTALELSQSRARRTPFIIFTGCLDEATAVLCMKLGAWDYVLKQNPVRLVACIRSALERRRLVEEREQAIIEGEQRFRQVADVAPVLIWMSDASGSFHYFNRAWLDFRGRTEAQERHTGWIGGIHPGDRGRCEHTLQEKIATLQPCRIEFRLQRRDGEYRWMLCHGAPYYTAKGRFSGYIGSGVDITDVRTAESTSARGNELAVALVEAMPGVAYAKDALGRFIAANRAALLFLDRSHEALQVKTSRESGIEAAHAAVLARENEVLRSGSPSNGDSNAPDPGGRLTIRPWGVAESGASGIIATELTRSGNGVSPEYRHDFNNLLAIIRMGAEFLGEQPALNGKLRGMAVQMTDASDKLQSLLASLAEPAESENTGGRP